MDTTCRIFVVDLDKKTCQCREFQLNQFICAHGVAACGTRGLSVYNFIDKFYMKEEWRAAYSGVVHAIGSTSTWGIPEDIKNRVVRPPVSKKTTGRPKSSRILSVGEEVVKQKCSRCSQPGHNRLTCRNVIPVRSTIVNSSTSQEEQ